MFTFLKNMKTNIETSVVLKNEFIKMLIIIKY